MATDASLVRRALALAEALYAKHGVPSDHGMEHIGRVLAHADAALRHEKLAGTEALCVRLAVVLHDADDAKFFKTPGLANARALLAELAVGADQEKLVLELIALVACRHNHNDACPNEWKLIPRYCDRLDAIGKIGLWRCYAYSRQNKEPLFTEATPRATTLEELRAIATKERFEAYRGVSASLVDHLYDKIIPVGNATPTNAYLAGEFARNQQCAVDFALRFGRTGKVDPADLAALE